MGVKHFPLNSIIRFNSMISQNFEFNSFKTETYKHIKNVTVFKSLSFVH